MGALLKGLLLSHSEISSFDPSKSSGGISVSGPNKAFRKYSGLFVNKWLVGWSLNEAGNPQRFQQALTLG